MKIKLLAKIFFALTVTFGKKTADELFEKLIKHLKLTDF